MITLRAVQCLLNHINETHKTIKNESKLLHFIIQNKRNYHRGRIRFRHLIEVSRKQKQIISKWNGFSRSITNNISKNNIHHKASSIISYIDCIGRDTKLFTDIIMKCVGSFVAEYILSGHDVNFCYLTIAILGRLYSLFCSRLHQMAETRKTLYVFQHKINPDNYALIYWNDLQSFTWPHTVIHCSNSNQFDEDRMSSIDKEEMDEIIKRIYANNYGISRMESVMEEKDDGVEIEDVVMEQKVNEDKNKNNRNKLIGQKRKRVDNGPSPPKKKAKTIHSTFELMESNDKKIKQNRNKKSRNHRKKRKKKCIKNTSNIEQSESEERDEIDDIFGDIGL